MHTLGLTSSYKRIDYAQSVITFELMRDKKLILNKS